MKLWYSTPAARWIDSLPLGNGRLGLMADGGVQKETFYINDDTLWSGYPKSRLNPQSAAALPEIRRLLLAGKNTEAEALLKSTSLGDWSEAYEPLGTLTIRCRNLRTAADYRRALDLDDGVHISRFYSGGKVRKEAFCSCPDQLGAVHITSEKPLHVTLRLTSPLQAKTCAGESSLLLYGHAPDTSLPNYCRGAFRPVRYDEHRAMAFCAGIKAVTDGKVQAGRHALHICSAHEITIYIFTATGFRGFDKMPETDTRPLLDEIRQKLARSRDYETIRQNHIADYKKLFGRTVFRLAGCEKVPAGSDLVRMAKSGRIHPALPVLYYQYARYMTICGSRPGTQPLNLQGIWNDRVRAPWSSNYTNNINVQMNYWFTAGANLRECLEPYERFLHELRVTGGECARVNYGCGGFAVNHNADLWRKATPVKDDPVYAYFPLGGVWLANELFAQARCEDSDEKLRRVFPVLQASVQFCLDWLTEQDGQLVTCPSVSPELHFIKNDRSCAQDVATAFDMGLVRQALQDYLTAAETLGETALTKEASGALARLKPFAVDESGQLLEWSAPYRPQERGHRHFSPLYGIYPGDCLLKSGDDTLICGARKLLDTRMDAGSGQTGWSAAWAACLYARFKDSEAAFACLQKLWGNSTHTNLFDKHPPNYFQIDGNFGGAAAIQEMLVQTYTGVTELLPALPKAWPNGEMRGLVLPGGIVCSIAWQNGKLARAAFKAPADTVLTVACGGQKVTLHLTAGQTLQAAGELWREHV